MAAAGAAVFALVSYLALAAFTPGLALLLASLALFLALLGAILSRWPAERKITLERQIEVVGYRLLITLFVYYALGFALLWGLNQISPEQARVPLAWDAPMTQPWAASFVRRVSFWPFYALVLVGCHGALPTPPGAC